MEITNNQAHALATTYGTPLYIYDQKQLEQRAQLLLRLPMPFGLTVRYAVKANPHQGITRLFHEAGVHFDASSSYEAQMLLDRSIPGTHISVSSQQPAHNLQELLDAGVKYTASSLHQLELFAQMAPGQDVGLRVNPGVGSGHNNRTTTGGVNSSFGLWHEHLQDALTLARHHSIVITTLHVHVGSGADASAWGDVMDSALAIVTRMPDVTTLNIGGGYKVRRVEGETETNMQQVVEVFAQKLTDFAKTSGRKLHLEIEPGSWLVANSGMLLTEIVDIVNTGATGHEFLRTNTGMNDIMRPTLYGAQHNMRILNDATDQTDYIIVGHNCETGDILSPAPRNPEELLARRLNRAQIGDLLAIADTGAYCASLSAKGYNAYPSAKEVLIG